MRWAERILIILVIIYGEDAFSQRGGIFSPVFIDYNNSVDKSERYLQYEGKIIKTLHIKTLEPFGTSVDDTTDYHPHLLGRIGNTLHITTRESVIRNIILLKEGQPFNALNARESERIIRQTGFVRDARLRVVETEDGMVEVHIVSGDFWSIVPNIYSLRNPYEAGLTEGNFLGISHRLDANLIYDAERNHFASYGSYTIPFIRNTFGSLSAFYSAGRDGEGVSGISLQRPLLSSVFDWAGGAEFIRNTNVYEMPGEQREADQAATGFNTSRSRSAHWDYWLMRSFKVGVGESARARNTRIAVAGRVSGINFSERIAELSDTIAPQENSLFVLGTVGYFIREYFIDRDIYRFGITEDIPIGLLVSFTGGYQIGEISSRPYFKLRAALGRHIENFGNISGAVNFGTFMNRGALEQGAFTYNAGYFSDMFRMGRWGLRQFIYTLGYYGINRRPHESVNLNADNELFGFNAPGLMGTKKAALNFNTVFYAPRAFAGFRFAPVVLLGFGMLGDDNAGLFSGRIFQSYGGGLLIRNESLFFQTIRLSFVLFPGMQGLGGAMYNFNPIGTYDLRYQDFFTQKPGTVVYR
jgi:hypothetical protein